MFSLSQSFTGMLFKSDFMKEAIASSALFEQQEVDGFHHVELQCLPLTLRN